MQVCCGAPPWQPCTQACAQACAQATQPPWQAHTTTTATSCTHTVLCTMEEWRRAVPSMPRSPRASLRTVESRGHALPRVHATAAGSSQRQSPAEHDVLGVIVRQALSIQYGFEILHMCRAPASIEARRRHQRRNCWVLTRLQGLRHR